MTCHATEGSDALLEAIAHYKSQGWSLHQLQNVAEAIWPSVTPTHKSASSQVPTLSAEFGFVNAHGEVGA